MLAKNKSTLEHIADLPVVHFGLAVVIGLLIGFGNYPTLLSVTYVGIAVLCIFFTFTGNRKLTFTLLPYLAYSEIVVKGTAHSMPYLFAPYTMMIVFGIMIIQQLPILSFHSKAFMFMVIFAIIEYVNGVRADDPLYGKFLMVQSSLLAIVGIWSSSNILTAKMIQRFLYHVKAAGMYLCGVVAAAHVTGNIIYASNSSSTSTNGLAPVQISGYLGWVSILFFLSIVNPEERKPRIVNIAAFCFSTILMILSFSRGGAYFLAAVMALYFIFNSKKMSSYYFMFLFIPLTYIVYTYTNEATGGLIVQRYQEEGTSGRDELVWAGIELFERNPLTGVGTGNFVSEIKKQNLYSEESGAHNEFVRAAAEHGILGITTYLLFYFFMFYEILIRKKIQREYGLYFFILFCLILVHNGLKISVQPLILMVVMATPTFIYNKDDKK